MVLELLHISVMLLVWMQYTASISLVCRNNCFNPTPSYCPLICYWHWVQWSHLAGITRTALAIHPRTRRVQSSIPGSPVAVRADASLLGRWLLSRVWQHSRSLHSADVSTSVVLRTLISYGDRTFAAAGPRLWNSLPVHSCVIPTSPTDCSDDSWRDTFFGKHEHGALWLKICGAIENTYLRHMYSMPLYQCIDIHWRFFLWVGALWMTNKQRFFCVTGIVVVFVDHFMHVI